MLFNKAWCSDDVIVFPWREGIVHTAMVISFNVNGRVLHSHSIYILVVTFVLLELILLKAKGTLNE